MTADSGDVARAKLLLSGLFLAQDVPLAGVLGQAPLAWVTEWLKLGPDDHFGADALRHLVAVQLAPRDAVEYDHTNSDPRWRLVDRYLADRFTLPAEERVPIARRIAATLDRAGVERGARLLPMDQAVRCAICSLPFQRNPPSVATRDPYKPTWRAPEELCRPEADHIVPISSLGAHNIDNLQVICRACNLAKGSGLIVDPDTEIRFCGLDPSEVPRVHLFRLLQWLIHRDDGRCEQCGGSVNELTMRPVHRDAPIARGTLTLRCYDCI